MTKRIRRYVIAGSVVVAVIAAILAAARAAAPGWIRGRIEDVASRTLGRDLKIAGALDLSFSLTPTLSAGDVTLANAPWGSEPCMVRVGHVKVALDLLSLWTGPIRVPEVQIDDVRVLLEADDSGRGNWNFELKPAAKRPEGAPERPIVVVERAAIRGFELAHRPRPGGRPLAIGVADLEARLDPASRMIDVRGNGHFNDEPWDLAGRIGPLENLYTAHNLDQALTAHIGRSSLSLSGSIHDPKTLGGPNVEVSIDGPDIAASLAVFGLRSPLAGPFRARAAIAPKGDGVGVEVSAALGGVTAQARGRVNSILEPLQIDATVEAAGPDAAVVGSWTGVKYLPPRPFSIAGRVRRDGPSLSLDDVEARVGGTSLKVSGPLGQLPRCIGIDLQVEASGTDLSELSALTRLRMPADPFTVTGRFLRRADGLAIEDTEVQVRGSTVHASGMIGQPPKVANLDLTADATGPDASWISGIARIEIPPEPFVLHGRVTWNATAVGLDAITGRLGDAAFEVDGTVLPVKTLAGTDAHLRVSGHDLAKDAALAGIHGLPGESFEAVGNVKVFDDRIELDDVDVRVGRLVARTGGHVGMPAPLVATSLECRVRGAALSDLAAWGVNAKLPTDSFAAAGGLRIVNGTCKLEDVSAEVGKDSVTVDGTLGSLPDLAALDVAVQASGPDLAAVGRFFPSADAEALKRVPAEPFNVSGRVRRVASGVELEGAKAAVGEAKLGADGTLAWGERWLGTNLRLAFEAPDASIVEDLTGIKVPEGTVRANGRVALVDAGVFFDGATATLGPSYVELSGTLGTQAKLAGTELTFSVEGPDLAGLLGPLSGVTWLPADAFALSAHLVGSTDRFASDRFSGRIGQSDVEGSVSVGLAGKPILDADLRAKHIDVPSLLRGFGAEPVEDQTPATSGKDKKKRRDKNARLISDKPLALGPLRALDASVRLAAAEVFVPGVPMTDVDIAVGVRDGTLTVDRFEGTVANGGRTTASLSVTPRDGGYLLHAEGRLDGGQLSVEDSGEASKAAPSLDIEFEVDGAGPSLHDIAASAEGRALVILGSGRIPNTMFGKSSADVIAVMDAINPFRKSTPYTELECGVAAAEIEQGRAAVVPISIRTDKLTVLGKGGVNFATEAMDLIWTIKPRQNVGITAGSIANPYVKLGGTLSAPALEVKPLEAAASTGAAVATAGLTILFRGIYNRITAEKKVCVQAMDKARKQQAKQAKRKAAKPAE